jgi:hypothetical protein
MEMHDALLIACAAHLVQASCERQPYEEARLMLPEIREVLTQYRVWAAQGRLEPIDHGRAGVLMVYEARLSKAPMSLYVFAILRMDASGVARRVFHHLRALVEDVLVRAGYYSAYWELRTQLPTRALVGADWFRDTRSRRDVQALLAIGNVEAVTARLTSASVRGPRGIENIDDLDGLMEVAIAATQPTRKDVATAWEQYAVPIDRFLSRARRQGFGPSEWPTYIRGIALLTIGTARSGGDVDKLEDLWANVTYDVDNARYQLGVAGSGFWLAALAARGQHAQVATAVAAHHADGSIHAFTTGWSLALRAVAALYGHAHSRDLLTATDWTPQQTYDEAWHHATNTMPDVTRDELAPALAGDLPLLV